MFYVPEEINDDYSEGFRKLIKRAVNRLNK